MADLRSIEGRTRPAQVLADVVEILQRTLQEAREGKITSVALAICRSDNDVETIASPSDNFHRMLGAVSQLQFNMASNKHNE